ncbi:formate hydrogenlyase maturation HycH family protein [Azospirillum sp. ST 5-10]|uniref:formate hydrogenlyase maturation HycH family protein n=1 Tax=unclassified Azospirillum TaxID=2630922 RepID=UPI003F4A1608
MADRRVVFHQLTRQFAHGAAGIGRPPRLVYYSLGFGHEVGVTERFTVILDLPDEAYTAWIGKIPHAEARRKLAGALHWGETTIDATHARLLRTALAEALPRLDEVEAAWTRILDAALRLIETEPELYVIARLR